MKLTAKQTDLMRHVWSARFARSMTLTDFSPQTIGSLEQKGLIAWDHEADARPGAVGPAKYGLTAWGQSYCRQAFGADENGSAA